MIYLTIFLGLLCLSLMVIIIAKDGNRPIIHRAIHGDLLHSAYCLLDEARYGTGDLWLRGTATWIQRYRGRGFRT